MLRGKLKSTSYHRSLFCLPKQGGEWYPNEPNIGQPVTNKVGPQKAEREPPRHECHLAVLPRCTCYHRPGHEHDDVHTFYAQGTYNALEIYNPITNTWRLGPKMAAAAHGIHPVLYDGEAAAPTAADDRWPWCHTCVALTNICGSQPICYSATRYCYARRCNGHT